MKICYLANARSIHTRRWADFFSKRGHHVEILTFEPAVDVFSVRGVHRIGRRLPLKMQYFLYARSVRSLVRQIRPDILHAHYASGYATLGRLARFHPYVVSVWGSDVFDFPTKSLIHRRIVSANLECADEVCSTSHVMAEKTQSLCPREVVVTPFGVDCGEFRPRSSGNEGSSFVIGIVKALEPKYGVEYLIRGFALFLRQTAHSDRAQLVVVGGGSLKGSLQQLANDLGVASRTTFLGHVPHGEVPGVLNSFSVFVAPSVLESESFGVAVVEASASGLPVVVSRIGGLTEVVRDGVTGILVPPRDSQAIADALEKLASDNALCLELGRNGRQFVLANYEWTENASRMERIYVSLLAQGRRPSIF